MYLYTFATPKKEKTTFKMKLTKETRQAIVSKFGGNAKNTGAAEVQVALLTERILHITGHLGGQKNDVNSARGLMRLVSQRKRLLHHLSETNLTSYRQLIKDLNLRK